MENTITARTITRCISSSKVLRNSTRKMAPVFGSVIALLTGACLVLLAMDTDAIAAGVKPDAPCKDLERGDITITANPSCKAVSAIYLDKDGNWVYFEKLGGPRVIEVAPPCKKVRAKTTGDCGPEDWRGDCADIDPMCPSSCLKPSCYVCLDGRCGCVC